MKMYRVLYEKRRKPRCTCCEYLEAESDNHEWTTHGTEPRLFDEAHAERDRNKAWDWHSEYEEVRNVRVETTEMEWKEWG